VLFFPLFLLRAITVLISHINQITLSKPCTVILICHVFSVQGLEFREYQNKVEVFYTIVTSYVLIQEYSMLSFSDLS
jgi:hypothetical protein